MAVGDGITWNEAVPVDGTIATEIDDYDRDLRKGVRSRMANEHEWVASQTGTSEGGAHKYITLQAQGATPTMGATQLGVVYLDTNGAVVYSSSGGSDIIIVNATGGKRSGDVVRIDSTNSSTYTTVTDSLPADDTKPQITEGGELLTMAVTAADTANSKMIEVLVNCGATQNARGMVVALFRGTTADSLIAGATVIPNAEDMSQIKIMFTDTVSTLDAVTYSVRGGCKTKVDFYMNGANTGRIFGGSAISYMNISEIQA